MKNIFFIIISILILACFVSCVEKYNTENSNINKKPISTAHSPKNSFKNILLVNTNLEADDLYGYDNLKNSVNEILPDSNIEIIHYEILTTDYINSKNINSIIFGGQGTPWYDYPPEKLNKIFKVIKNLNIPTLGICGGHQLIALSFGSEVSPIKVIDSSKKGYAGCWREKGYTKIQILKDDIIFPNINGELLLYENHCDEVKNLPPGFEQIASGINCKIQGIKHKDRPIYGIQFHPEVYTLENNHGKILLSNFLKLI